MSADLVGRLNGCACDVCAGTGRTTHGGPCICGGTGACADEKVGLRAEIERLRADAARYRWLRESADSVIDWDFMPNVTKEFLPLENGCAFTLDAAIDAALTPNTKDQT